MYPNIRLRQIETTFNKQKIVPVLSEIYKMLHGKTYLNHNIYGGGGRRKGLRWATITDVDPVMVVFVGSGINWKNV